jgi:steroid 5-alpha reductase family enzyme
MEIYLFPALILVLCMVALFLGALVVKDNSIIDIAYGPLFVLAGAVSYLGLAEGHPRQVLLMTMIGLWGLRLGTHIFLRKRGEQGEDPRYRQWRESWAKSFVWRSFLQIFMLQGAVIYLVGLPLLLVIDQPGGSLGVLDLLGGLIWLTGFLFEAVGDWQLLRFKRDPANRGKIMQQGLWRYTRHPNYFGEAILWWGVFLVACATPWGLLALVSPLLINFLLLKVSGIPMLEARYAGRRDFEAYRQRTNAFFPWFPQVRREIKNESAA